MSLEKPQRTLRERYLLKTDKNGYLKIGDFSTQELQRQSKSVAAFLDGDEGTNPDINLGTDLKFQGSSGNYSDMKIHTDDLEEFIKRVRDFYGN